MCPAFVALDAKSSPPPFRWVVFLRGKAHVARVHEIAD